MTPRLWNPDDATMLTGQEPDIGRPARYGETGWESSHHEPLDVALAQELPDASAVVDEQWADLDVDDFTFTFEVEEDADAPEELAMHVVEI